MRRALLLLLSIILTLPLAAAERGYPVILGRDTICTVNTGNGALSAAGRAVNDSRLIAQTAEVYMPSIDSLTITKVDGAVLAIAFGDKVILAITAADTVGAHQTAEVLAAKYRERIVSAIVDYQKDRSLSTILSQIGLSVAVLAATWVVVWLLARLFKRKIVPFVRSKKGVWFNGVKLRGYEILDADREVQLALFLVGAVRWTLTAVAVYIALPLMFSIYPITQRLASMLLGWVWDPVRNILLGTWHYIPDLLTIAIIIVVVRYILRWIKALARDVQSGKITIPGFYADWARTTYTLIRTVIYILTFIFIFPYLPGSDNKVFQGVSVLVGVIVSLGSTSVVSNMMAGLVITYMRPFLKGDRVKIGDVTGDVLEKTPFVTRIKTYKKEIVTIPNAQILSGNVTNYSTSARDDGGVALSTTITIGYEVDWRHVHQMMIQAALLSELVLKDPAPYVLQTSLDNSYVSYQICAYVSQANRQNEIYSELHQNLQDVFAQNGVEILSPDYRSMRNGNGSTVPSGQ